MERKKNLTAVENEKAIEMFPGFFRTTLVYNNQLMLCHFKMNKGAEIPLHHHVAVQNGYLIKGKVELVSADGSRKTIEPGAAYVFDSEVVHGAYALEDSEYVESFFPVRPEYYPEHD